MIELGLAKRNVIVPVCANSLDVPVRSAMEGIMGRVWVPDLENPSFCLIKLGTFAYVLGVPPKGERTLELLKVIRTECGGTFIKPENEHWINWMESSLEDGYRTVSRYALKYDEARFDREKLKSYAYSLPEGYVMKKIDRTLFRQLLKEDWSAPFVSNFENEDQFEKSGTGYGILKGKELVSGCSACGFSEGMMEMDAETKTEYRRKGLSACAAAKFLLDCLDRNLKPNWNTFSLHMVSVAKELGYTLDRDITVFQIAPEDFE